MVDDEMCFFLDAAQRCLWKVGVLHDSFRHGPEVLAALAEPDATFIVKRMYGVHTWIFEAFRSAQPSGLLMDSWRNPGLQSQLCELTLDARSVRWTCVHAAITNIFLHCWTGRNCPVLCTGRPHRNKFCVRPHFTPPDSVNQGRQSFTPTSRFRGLH